MHAFDDQVVSPSLRDVSTERAARWSLLPPRYRGDHYVQLSASSAATRFCSFHISEHVIWDGVSGVVDVHHCVRLIARMLGGLLVATKIAFSISGCTSCQSAYLTSSPSDSGLIETHYHAGLRSDSWPCHTWHKADDAIHAIHAIMSSGNHCRPM